MRLPRLALASTLGLALAMGAGNALAYVFTIAMSRLLGAGDFGALGTLLAVWIVSQIPALAWQLTVATAVVNGTASVPRLARSGLGLGVLLGLVLASAAPVLAAVLHVGVAAVLWLAAWQVPGVVMFALLGALQGQRRFPAYGLLFVGFHLARLVVGIPLVRVGAGPAGAVFAAVIAAGVAAYVGMRFCGVPVAALLAAGGPRPGLWTALARATVSSGALLLFTTADLLLAGHYLLGDARGVYASGNVLTRVAYWGLQFISTLAYPRLASPADRVRARRTSLLAIVGIGALGLAVAAVAGRLIVRVVFGTAYGSLGPLVALFVLIGVSAAVINVVLFDDVATGSVRGTSVCYAAVAVEAVLVVTWFHGRPAEVVGTAAGVCALSAVLAVLMTARVSGDRAVSGDRSTEH